MSNKQKFGPDNWLYILTNAIANYTEEGGQVVTIQNDHGEILVRFVGVTARDARLHPDFVAMVKADEQA